jgi:hypothetical protein
MIEFKITPEVADVMDVNYNELPEIVGEAETNFLIDVENLPFDDELLNFYYMNAYEGMIQAYPFRPMFEGKIPESVLAPSILGNLKRAIFLEGLPYSEETKEKLQTSLNQYKLSRMNADELNSLHTAYKSEQKLIHKEIEFRMKRK